MTTVNDNMNEIIRKSTRVIQPDDYRLMVDVDTLSRDAFGRLRVSNANVIFETSFIETDRSDIYDTATASGGTVVREVDKAHMTLNTTTTSGSSAEMRSTQRIKYTPGQSNLNLFVAKFAVQDNCTSLVGLHDGSDGFLIGTVNGVFGISNTSSYTGTPVVNRIEQHNFNLDKLDGTGPSRRTLDLTKINIFGFDYQWLGAGAQRFFVIIEGKITYFHQINHANVSADSKYIRTASLPVRAYIQNTAATAEASLLVFSCCSVISEGLADRSSLVRSEATLNPTVINNNDFKPIISLRLKSSSRVANLRPIRFDVIGTSNVNILVEVRLNGVLGGDTAWTSVSGVSQAEIDSGSTTITGGEVIGTFYLTARASNEIGLDSTLKKIGKFIDGSSALISISSISLGNNADAYASITWEEIY